MSGPFKFVPEDFEEAPWAEIMFSAYDSLCAFWETMELPPHLQGDDIWQDLFLYYAGKEELPEDFSIRYIRRAGMLYALNLIRTEMGREKEKAWDVDGEEQEQRTIPRVFFDIDDLYLTVQGSNTEFWCVERASVVADELSKRLSVLSPDERELLYLVHAEGWKHADLAKLRGVSVRTIREHLVGAKKKAASVQL